MKDIAELDLKICKYKVLDLKLTVPGINKPFSVNPVTVSDIIIDKDFDKYQFPYLRLIISVPNKIYRAMKKANNGITAYLRICKSFFNHDDTAGSVNKDQLEYPFLVDNFFVFMDDNSPHLTTEMEEIIESTTPEVEDDVVDLNNATNMEIMLYRKNDMNIIKQTPTGIYHNAYLIDILTHYLKLTGFSKVLCSPPDNNKTRYPEFILPPLRPDEQILRICADFAMHKYGTTLFFDFDRVYILNKCNKCTAWARNEYKQTFVLVPPVENQLGSLTQGCCYVDEERAGYCSARDVTVESTSMEREQVFGSSMKAIDKKTGNITEIKPDTVTIPGGGASSRFIVSYEGDASTATALKQRLEEESMNISICIDAVELDMLTPNKEFNLSFLSYNLAKYSGVYRLVGYTTTFSRNDGLWFTPTVLARFVGKKPK